VLVGALPLRTQEKLEAYLALLLKWNRAFNLRRYAASRIVTHHVLDALAVPSHLPQLNRCRC
jgi:16S rRNA G527 N7-methylase RsmG